MAEKVVGSNCSWGIQHKILNLGIQRLMMLVANTICE
jgi:hypothetical protein